MKFHDSFSDFVLFLCIHVAYADGSLHAEEEKVILEKIQKLFPLEGNPKNKFNEAVQQYQAFQKTQINEFIHYSFRHFQHIPFAQRYKIYTDMYEIVHADGKVEEAETKAMNTLKQIIDLGAHQQPA
jgi:uncharacterized tellurite resistance protein B-like protein